MDSLDRWLLMLTGVLLIMPDNPRRSRNAQHRHASQQKERKTFWCLVKSRPPQLWGKDCANDGQYKRDAASSSEHRSNRGPLFSRDSKTTETVCYQNRRHNGDGRVDSSDDDGKDCPGNAHWSNVRPHWRGASDLRNANRTRPPRPVQADGWTSDSFPRPAA
jgi:hypothetical protein